MLLHTVIRDKVTSNDRKCIRVFRHIYGNERHMYCGGTQLFIINKYQVKNGFGDELSLSFGMLPWSLRLRIHFGVFIAVVKFCFVPKSCFLSTKLYTKLLIKYHKTLRPRAEYSCRLKWNNKVGITTFPTKNDIECTMLQC